MWILGAHNFTLSPDQGPVPFPFTELHRSVKMSQPGPRQTKKQKKALVFRAGKKKNRVLDDEDAFGFPVDENQDLAGLTSLPLEVEKVSTGGKAGSRKGEAQRIGHHQVQPGGSKKRKREGEDAVGEKPPKKSRVRPVAPDSGVEEEGCQESVVVKKKGQPQRFILFIGTFWL